jgi:hypothetical protein
VPTLPQRFRKFTPSIDDAASNPVSREAFAPPECIVARKISAGFVTVSFA